MRIINPRPEIIKAEMLLYGIYDVTGADLQLFTKQSDELAIRQFKAAFASVPDEIKNDMRLLAYGRIKGSKITLTDKEGICIFQYEQQNKE